MNYREWSNTTHFLKGIYSWKAAHKHFQIKCHFNCNSDTPLSKKSSYEVSYKVYPNDNLLIYQCVNFHFHVFSFLNAGDIYIQDIADLDLKFLNAI